MPCCTDDKLCEPCYGRELLAKSRQAGVVGQCWAERICRGELRAQQAWPEHDEKTIRIARGKVRTLAKDPRLLDQLAAACSRGAAAWWARRPRHYRIEFVTAPDERERCRVVVGAARCPAPTEFRIAAEDGALDDYAHTCSGHRELVAGPGCVVTAVERGERVIG